MEQPDVDLVFKALADPTRRRLLDRLREQDGLTLGALCDGLDMTRQSATQHLALLEAANLISTRKQGRQKLHHLNVVPLHEIQERWIDTFERPRLRALAAIKQQAEATMTTPANTRTYRYVTYIEAPIDTVWQALTDPEITTLYWAHRNESDWQPGSTWAHVRNDDSGAVDVQGLVVESDPPTRLVTTWAGADGQDPNVSTVTMDLTERGGVVKLTVTHEDLIEDHYRQISNGWPAVLSNLKSYLETGRPLATEPWRL